MGNLRICAEDLFSIWEQKKTISAEKLPKLEKLQFISEMV